MLIKNYHDFVTSLLNAGFSMGGGNSEGIFSVIPWSWNEAPPNETPIRWHTGDPETDPWEWRIRVLEERDDIAYAKLFFNKSGYITKEWYPYFLAVRRGGRSLIEAYEDGMVSSFAKRIYDVVSNSEAIPLHEIKQIGGFSRADSLKFERALVELQSKMFVTMCGSQRKISKKGEAYGWSSTVFCTVERYFGEEVMIQADKIDEGEAMEMITQQIYRLNPAANPRRIARFIKG
jgi:hypothetical protein